MPTCEDDLCFLLAARSIIFLETAALTVDAKARVIFGSL